MCHYHLLGAYDGLTLCQVLYAHQKHTGRLKGQVTKFSHSLSKYWILLCARDIKDEQHKHGLCPHGAYSFMEEGNNKHTNESHYKL